MISWENVAFESEISKIDVLSPSSAVLFSGSLSDRKCLLNAISPSYSETDISRVFSDFRRKRIEEKFLNPFHITFLDLFTKLEYSSLLKQIQSFEIQCYLLFAKISNGVGSIFQIGNPGVSENYDILGWNCIGSGEAHATRSLIKARYSTNLRLSQALYLVYKAKKDSEVSPEVGITQTDIAVLSSDGIRFLDNLILAKLSKFHEELYNMQEERIQDFDLEI